MHTTQKKRAKFLRTHSSVWVRDFLQTCIFLKKFLIKKRKQIFFPVEQQVKVWRALRVSFLKKNHLFILSGKLTLVKDSSKNILQKFHYASEHIHICLSKIFMCLFVSDRKEKNVLFTLQVELRTLRH